MNSIYFKFIKNLKKNEISKLINEKKYEIKNNLFSYLYFKENNQSEDKEEDKEEEYYKVSSLIKVNFKNLIF